MNIVLLGGTKGIGRALGRLLVEKGHAVCLLGRNEEDVLKSAEDMRIRAPNDTSVASVVCDLSKPDSFAPALDAAWAYLDKIDAVIVTAALFGTQEELEASRERARELLTVNFANTIVFLEEARVRLLADGGGTLCALSSVAGERGRKPVILYGASKAGLSAYLEGLDHKFREQGLKTVCIKPGFVKTGMTAGLKPPPFAGEADDVARDILKAVESGKPVVYTRGMWRFVMLVIRNLPRFVMRKIGF